MATVGTLLFLLVIAGTFAIAAVAVVALLLGAIAGLTTALAALIERLQQQRPHRADRPRRGFLRGRAPQR